MLGLWRAVAAALVMGFSAPMAAAQDLPVKIVALGDSLTAGYGIAANLAFPVQLERALKARGHAVEIVNAGVSGDTASGGLARLDWSVPADTDAVIVELGANDALRGVDPAVSRKALDAILKRLTERKIPVLLAGMRAPPNLGAEYASRFDPIFPALAKQYDALLYPFFLTDVAAVRTLNLPDGVHPTAEGVAVIVQGILPMAEELIARVKQGRAAKS
jgi:acyl-CoA thioesterase-1